MVLGIRGGVVYAFNRQGNWYKWTGASRVELSFDPFA